MTLLRGLHPGSAHFSLDARRRVARQGPFNLLRRGDYVRAADDRDLLAALLLAQGLADGRTAGGGHAARLLGFAYPARPLAPQVQDIIDLGRRGDRGEYADPVLLHEALLGEGGLLP